MGCSAAIRTDEYHGWECDITGGPCMFLYPDSKACAERFGEGPDASDDLSDYIPETDDKVYNSRKRKIMLDKEEEK